MLNATKVRLYPVLDQRNGFSGQFGAARWVYNKALNLKKTAFEDKGESISCYALKVLLPSWKKEHEWLKDSDSQVLQQSVLHLDVAYKRFFAKKGRYPKFKSKYGKQSIQYPQRVKIEGSSIYFPKIGWVKAVIHRPIEGKIKTVTVSRSVTGKYYASILTENETPAPPVAKHIEQVVGIDLGVVSLVTDSDGNKWENPRFLKKARRNLRIKQKKLSRKIKRSHSWAKAKRLVAKAYEKLSFARNDFQHKLSHTIAGKNQAVGVEDLNIKGMLKNRKLARCIQDASWSSLIAKINYKLQRKGRVLVKIDRFFPSSKRCPACHHVNEELQLSDRLWTCVCKCLWDRDIAAACNIRQEAILILKAAGHTVSACGGSRKTREILAAAYEAGSSLL